MTYLRFNSTSVIAETVGKIKIVDFSMSPYTIADNEDIIIFDTTNGIVEAILPDADNDYSRKLKFITLDNSANVAKLKTATGDYFETTNNYMIFYPTEYSKAEIFAREGGWNFNANNITISTGATNGRIDALMGKASPKFRRVYTNNEIPLSTNELTAKSYVDSLASSMDYEVVEFADSPYTPSGNSQFLFCDTTNGNITINLNSAESFKGKNLIITKGSDDANKVIVNRNGTDEFYHTANQTQFELRNRFSLAHIAPRKTGLWYFHVAFGIYYTTYGNVSFSYLAGRTFQSYSFISLIKDLTSADSPYYTQESENIFSVVTSTNDVQIYLPLTASYPAREIKIYFKTKGGNNKIVVNTQSPDLFQDGSSSINLVQEGIVTTFLAVTGNIWTVGV